MVKSCKFDDILNIFSITDDKSHVETTPSFQTIPVLAEFIQMVCDVVPAAGLVDPLSIRDAGRHLCWAELS